MFFYSFSLLLRANIGSLLKAYGLVLSFFILFLSAFLEAAGGGLLSFSHKSSVFTELARYMIQFNLFSLPSLSIIFCGCKSMDIHLGTGSLLIFTILVLICNYLHKL